MGRKLIAFAALISLACGAFQVQQTIANSAVPAASTFALVAHCVAVNTGTCTINTTGANVIVVWDVAVAAAVITIPTDNKSNTFTAGSGATWSLAGGNGSGKAYIVCVPTVGSSHIFTGGAAGGNYYFVTAFSGALGSGSCYDTGNGVAQFGGTSNTYNTGSITPSAANELLVSAALNDDNTSGTWSVPTVPATFTAVDSDTSLAALKTNAYVTDPGSGATNPNWVNSAQPNGGAGVAAIKHP